MADYLGGDVADLEAEFSLAPLENVSWVPDIGVPIDYISFSPEEDLVITAPNTTSPPFKVTPTKNSVAVGKDSQLLIDTFRFYGTGLGIVFLTFCFARSYFPRAYNLRKKPDIEDMKPKDAKYFHRFTPLSNRMESDLAAEDFGFFSWFWRLYTLSDDEFMEHCGLDALCFTRVCSMGCKFCWMGMLNAIWLMPCYATANEVTHEADYYDRIVEITTSNVPQSSVRLTATVVASYCVFFQAMWIILREFKWFTKMRGKFLQKKLARNYAVYIRDIPQGFQSNQAITKFFEKSLAAGEVQEAHIAVKTVKLRSQVNKRDAVIMNLEHAIAELDETGIRPKHKLDKTLDLGMGVNIGLVIPGINLTVVPDAFDKLDLFGFIGGKEVDSITYYAEELLKFNADISQRIEVLKVKASSQPEDIVYESDDEMDLDGSAERSPLVRTKSRIDDEANKNLLSFIQHNTTDVLMKTAAKPLALTSEATNLVTQTVKGAANLVLSEDGEIKSAGFVVFKKLSTANAALQMVLHEHPHVLEVLEAPDPADIFWLNVGREHRDLQLGRQISLGLTVVACLFWTIPVTFTSSLGNIEVMRDKIEFIDELLTKYPGLEPVFQVLAPQLLVLLNASLPYIMEFVTMFEGPISGAMVQASVFSKLVVINILQTFFLTTLTGGVLNELQRLISRPQNFIDLLAKSLPTQSTFFMQYCIISTFSTFLVEGLRLGPISVGLFRKFVGPNLTARERQYSLFGVVKPLSEPFDFRTGYYWCQMVLYFMIYLVYSVIAPLVAFVAAFCFVVMGALFRHHFVYVYRPDKDSGGRVWMNFIKVLTGLMLVAECTIAALLSLKKAAVIVPWIIPLIVATVIFSFYIRERHFVVTEHLPMRLCLQQDEKNKHLDFSFVEDAFLQPEMRKKEELPIVPPERLEEIRELMERALQVNNPEKLLESGLMGMESSQLFQELQKALSDEGEAAENGSPKSSTQDTLNMTKMESFEDEDEEGKVETVSLEEEEEMSAYRSVRQPEAVCPPDVEIEGDSEFFDTDSFASCVMTASGDKDHSDTSTVDQFDQSETSESVTPSGLMCRVTKLFSP